ncbi:MAG: putative DNA modification/repair radical SAM protein [Lachnospiraceae bacterium]|nr:putative DNA modification/repair radical SAM protein [Lachnospiraceae bacterium]
MIFCENATLQEKLAILADGAKYDVACTSSGVERRGKKGGIGNTSASGICHSFAADGRCISLLKILFTNECIYNCKYCINRSSNDIPRATFTPVEICTLTMEFYRRNYIEGLFLSSGIVESPDHTMELICKALHDLRIIHRFNGYIHCKTIPGASPELVEEAGWYADRMSVNLEFPTAKGLQELAPNKTRKTILTPMRQIQNGVRESRELLGMKGGNQSAYWYTQKRLGRSLPGSTDVSEFLMEKKVQSTAVSDMSSEKGESESLEILRGDSHNMQGRNTHLSISGKRDISRGFVPSGQSTQMIIGATGESDYEIMAVTEALYQRFDLKRVFFSAFINVNQDSTLPAINAQPPLRREHRLYQADFLLRYYGFQASELLSESRPFFNTYLDPKCDWALGHLEQFPVEVSTADYQTLLRVPGIGTKSASRIVKARRSGKLDFQGLKTMGVVLKRAIYFITCYGKMMYHFMKLEEDYITRNLLENDRDVMKGFGEDVTYQQLSLFDVGINEGFQERNYGI